ncbi:MAG TPA: VOC family protein [Acidimicrobiales bacterium]|nr:VOC family protein [Acidimicrobiales bacterium]
MRLAKDSLDVGLYTDRYDELRAFYVDRLGLPYEELLKAGRGIHQHRVGLHGSVLKLNSSREPLADAPTTFIRLDLHGDHEAELVDPDGTEVRISPDVEQVAVHWATSNADQLAALLRDGFDATPVGDDEWRIGRTHVVLHERPVAAGPLRARGFRYLTVQVFDVRAEHARLLALGWREATAPIKLGETAYISFVEDPDGASIEISQRASLTGPLPT